MSDENTSLLNEKPIPTSSLDDLIQNIIFKTDQMKAVVNDINNDPNHEQFNTFFNQMTKCIEQISTVVSNNINILTETQIFKEDFHKSINTISMAIDSYFISLKSINSLNIFK